MEVQEAVVFRIRPARLELYSVHLKAVLSIAIARSRFNVSTQMLEGDQPRSRSVDGCTDCGKDSLFSVVHGCVVLTEDGCCLCFWSVCRNGLVLICPEGCTAFVLFRLSYSVS